jgi:hypothetical protein
MGTSHTPYAFDPPARLPSQTFPFYSHLGSDLFLSCTPLNGLDFLFLPGIVTRLAYSCGLVLDNQTSGL